MSEYAYDYRTLLAGSAEFDWMKNEIRTLISLTTSRLEKTELPIHAYKPIWSIPQPGHEWRIMISEHRWRNVEFVYGGELCLQFSLETGELRLPYGVSWLKVAHDYLPEYLEGMLQEFGAALGERLKLFSVLGERAMTKNT